MLTKEDPDALLYGFFASGPRISTAAPSPVVTRGCIRRRRLGSRPSWKRASLLLSTNPAAISLVHYTEYPLKKLEKEDSRTIRRAQSILKTERKAPAEMTEGQYK